MTKIFLMAVLLLSQIVVFAQDYTFYALSTDSKNAQPLYLCNLNADNGSIAIIKQYSGVYSGNYLALSADSKHLLVTSKNSNSSKSGIIQYNLADDGKLSFIKEALKPASELPCYVSYTPDIKYVMSASYGGDEISLYKFENHTISAEIDNIVKPDLSKGHFIITDPSGKYVHAVFLGLNKIFSYTIQNDKFVENSNQPSFSVPNGYGPRHMAFHTDKNFVYILNETHSSVTACTYNSETGVLTQIQDISMLPAGYTGTSNAAAIRIHPNGKFVYASNRGHNSIVVYKIEENGSLTFVEHETSGINFPRDFNISSDGKFMILGNQKGNSIMSLRIDESTGKLTNTGKSLTISKPLAFLFLPPKVNSSSNTINNDLNLVYPNPASNQLYLNAPNNECISKVELFNVNGQLVKSVTGHEIKAIEVSDVERGTYILIANSETKAHQQTILLQ